MNNSNAAAKARRAGIKPTTPVPTNQQNAQQTQSGTTNTNGLTLPQVISVIDRRLITLETFMKETKENPVLKAVNKNETDSGVEGEADIGFIVPSEFNAFVDEINSRFQILADEIETMKNALLKLQTFTMDVNKTILEKANIIIPDSVDDAIVSLDNTIDNEIKLEIESEPVEETNE